MHNTGRGCTRKAAGCYFADTDTPDSVIKRGLWFNSPTDGDKAHASENAADFSLCVYQPDYMLAPKNQTCASMTGPECKNHGGRCIWLNDDSDDDYFDDDDDFDDDSHTVPAYCANRRHVNNAPVVVGAPFLLNVGDGDTAMMVLTGIVTDVEDGDEDITFTIVTYAGDGEASIRVDDSGYSVLYYAPNLYYRGAESIKIRACDNSPTVGEAHHTQLCTPLFEVAFNVSSVPSASTTHHFDVASAPDEADGDTTATQTTTLAPATTVTAATSSTTATQTTTLAPATTVTAATFCYSNPLNFTLYSPLRNIIGELPLCRALLEKQENTSADELPVAVEARLVDQSSDCVRVSGSPGEEDQGLVLLETCATRILADDNCPTNRFGAEELGWGAEGGCYCCGEATGGYNGFKDIFQLVLPTPTTSTPTPTTSTPTPTPEPTPQNHSSNGWSAWSACTAVCGPGLRMRTRTQVSACAGSTGNGCPTSIETEACEKIPCSAAARSFRTSTSTTLPVERWLCGGHLDPARCGAFSREDCVGDVAVTCPVLCDTCQAEKDHYDNCGECTAGCWYYFDTGEQSCDCASDQFELEPPTEDQAYRDCALATECISGEEFEAIPLTASSDRDCEVATECIPGEEFEAIPLTASSDRDCEAISQCADDFKEDAAPTATSNRLCSRIEDVYPDDKGGGQSNHGTPPQGPPDGPRTPEGPGSHPYGLGRPGDTTIPRHGDTTYPRHVPSASFPTLVSTTHKPGAVHMNILVSERGEY